MSVSITHALNKITFKVNGRVYLLDIADNGTLWHVTNRLHIANGQCRLLATVDELQTRTMVCTYLQNAWQHMAISAEAVPGQSIDPLVQ